MHNRKRKFWLPWCLYRMKCNITIGSIISFVEVIIFIFIIWAIISTNRQILFPTLTRNYIEWFQNTPWIWSRHPSFTWWCSPEKILKDTFYLLLEYFFFHMMYVRNSDITLIRYSYVKQNVMLWIFTVGKNSCLDGMQAHNNEVPLLVVMFRENISLFLCIHRYTQETNSFAWKAIFTISNILLLHCKSNVLSSYTRKIRYSTFTLPKTQLEVCLLWINGLLDPAE